MLVNNYSKYLMRGDLLLLEEMILHRSYEPISKLINKQYIRFKFNWSNFGQKIYTTL